MYIIGISGKSGSGKNYIATNFLNPLLSLNGRVIEVAFADLMKLVVALDYPNLSYEELWIEKTPSIRTLLQTVGEEKRESDPDIWVRALGFHLKILKHQGFKYAIITDVRYRNEVDFIEKELNGVVLRVSRVRHNKYSHISETDLDNYPFEYVIDNDLLDGISAKAFKVISEMISK
jgi:hypothetical protein